jgi:hypothetical protein
MRARPRGDSPPARISASWLSVTHGWSSGVSLNDTTQMTVHTKLATPSTMNDARHPYRATTASTMGGVTAPPSRAQLCVMPCAKPRSRAGSHQVNARVAVGNAPPSPMPTSTRQTTSDSTLQDRPVRMVAAAQSKLSAARTRRGPNRSDAHPPAICIAGVRIREGRENQSELDRRQPEILPHRGTRHRDVHAIDVRNEVHQAQDEQNEVPDLQRRSPCASHHVRFHTV